MARWIFVLLYVMGAMSAASVEYNQMVVIESDPVTHCVSRSFAEWSCSAKDALDMKRLECLFEG